MADHMLFAAIAGAGFALAGMLGLLGVQVSNRTRLVSAAVASGILLGLAVVELMPEAIASAGGYNAAYGFAAGFIALFLLESVGRAHIHHHQTGHGHDNEHDLGEHHHRLLPFVVALGLHNFADGVVVGASTELADGAAAAVTAGVLIHQLPVGVSFAAVLTAMHAPRRIVMRSAVILGAAIPAGALAVALLPDLSGTTLGIVLGIAAGALVYVAAGHLLPEAQSEERSAAVVVAFPVVLAATVALFGTVLSHDHGTHGHTEDAGHVAESHDDHGDEHGDEHDAGEYDDHDHGHE